MTYPIFRRSNLMGERILHIMSISRSGGLPRYTSDITIKRVDRALTQKPPATCHMRRGAKSVSIKEIDAPLHSCRIFLRGERFFMFYDQALTTAESVTSGHPDKICDQISDAILDACLAQDPHSRVAIETFGSHGKLFIGGELTTNATIDAAKIATEVYASIGHHEKLDITTIISQQSPDIAQGVNTGGAGDQGIMYGYATNETPEYLPRASVLAHSLSIELENLRKNDPSMSWLRPDGKTQVTLQNNQIRDVVVSTQHDPNISVEDLRNQIKEKLIRRVIANAPDEDRIHINPTGIFTIGGFDADTGLTGRKIMVDTYGGLIPHGGGAFSGKDPSKVDRSAAYMCRYVAKNLVAHRYAKQCLVSVAYAIGKSEPLMIEAVDETGKNIGSIVRDRFDFRPRAIIERLNLLKPIYRTTATYGHFFRKDTPWEKIEDSL